MLFVMIVGVCTKLYKYSNTLIMCSRACGHCAARARNFDGYNAVAVICERNMFSGEERMRLLLSLLLVASSGLALQSEFIRSLYARPLRTSKYNVLRYE